MDFVLPLIVWSSKSSVSGREEGAGGVAAAAGGGSGAASPFCNFTCSYMKAYK